MGTTTILGLLAVAVIGWLVFRVVKARSDKGGSGGTGKGPGKPTDGADHF
jgi:hypothetical protein